jgi:hypothetical protein
LGLGHITLLHDKDKSQKKSIGLGRFSSQKRKNLPDFSRRRNMPHTGLETQLRFYRLAAKTVLNNIFTGQSPRLLQAKTALLRNQRIQSLHAEGELLRDIAQDVGVSPQRIWQIAQRQ